MSFNIGHETRHPTSYAELEGVEVKISDKYKCTEASFQPQAEMACMTLKDLGKLDQYEYSFEVEHLALQNYSTDDMQGQSPN